VSTIRNRVDNGGPFAGQPLVVAALLLSSRGQRKLFETSSAMKAIDLCVFSVGWLGGGARGMAFHVVVNLRW
jgi:hypothetical protein